MREKALVLPKNTQIDWGNFEKALWKKFGVNAVAYTSDGHRRTRGDINLVNGICYRIKKNPAGARRICDDVLGYMNHEARAKKRYITEECDAGMYKIVVPVIQEDELEGFVSTCGRPYVNSDRIYIDYIHETIDVDRAEIEQLLASLEPIRPRTVKAMIAFIASYA
jgi:ligand-binding sensor protein